MKSSFAMLALATLASHAFAAVVPLEARSTKVTGTAEGFAHGTTGGGSATPATPSSLAQLKSWLMDDVARVIVIDRE